MLYDFRPTGWKMTIILLQQPAINRAEEYMEWRAKCVCVCLYVCVRVAVTAV